MLTFPSEVEGEEVYLIAIKAHMVPLVSGLFAKMCNRYIWESDQDYEQAYNAFTYLRGCMLSCPLSELLEQNYRLYRLLDRAYFGTEYSVVSVDPLEIVPPIPVIPENEALIPGIVSQMDDARLKLQAIIEAIQESGQFDEDMLEQLTTIAGLLV